MVQRHFITIIPSSYFYKRPYQPVLISHLFIKIPISVFVFARQRLICVRSSQKTIWSVASLQYESIQEYAVTAASAPIPTTKALKNFSMDAWGYSEMVQYTLTVKRGYIFIKDFYGCWAISWATITLTIKRRHILHQEVNGRRSVHLPISVEDKGLTRKFMASLRVVQEEVLLFLHLLQSTTRSLASLLQLVPSYNDLCNRS